MNKIAFLGGGNMASSLVGGLIKKGANPNSLFVCDHNNAKRQQFNEQWAIQTFSDPLPMVRGSDIIVLAIKPQDLYDSLQSIKGALGHKPLLVSIAAGITTQQIQNWLSDTNYPIIRAMPNTPALINQGATALYATTNTNPKDKSGVQALFQGVGCTVWIDDEDLMDVVTALSGSGPAFFFYFMETLISEATSLGLPLPIAQTLCKQTALGSALLAQNAESVAQLRQQVTSKGGTTEAGLSQLTTDDFHRIIHDTLAKATERGQTLSQQFNRD